MEELTAGDTAISDADDDDDDDDVSTSDVICS